MKSEKPLVEIKGFGGTLGLLIDHTALFDQIEEELIQLLQRPNSKSFFRGAEIFLQPEGRQFTSDEFSRLQTLLAKEGALQLVNATAENIKSKKNNFQINTVEQVASIPSPASQASEASSPEETVEETVETPAEELSEETSSASETMSEDVVKEVVEQPVETPSTDSFFLTGVDTANALLVRQTLRSGQNLHSKSTVVLMGDLNAGAEIVSEGDIIVLGTIRGMVHAGVSGNRKALVFALRMQPTQIRIAELITQPPAEDKNFTSFEPEVAFIEDQSIVLSSKDIKNFVSK